MSLEWGSVGEWVGGLAAAGGLVFAALEIRAARRERSGEEKRRLAAETERREAMARAVSVNAYYHDADEVDDQAIPHLSDVEGLHSVERPGTEVAGSRYRMECRLHNGGDYPIDNVVLIISEPGAPRDADPQRHSACELVIGTLAAGATDEGEHLVHFNVEPVFGEFPNLAGVLFTDSWGQHWYRAPGQLMRRDGPPRVC